MAVGFVLAAILLDSGIAGAQFGIMVYGGGTVPVGEFGRMDVERTPPRSGATEGHLYGAEAAWRFTVASIPTILSVGYAESHFGNDAPTNILSDTMQFVTPESQIAFEAFRAGIYAVPWRDWKVSPTIGIGVQYGKLSANSQVFLGPNSNAQGTDHPVHLLGTSESDYLFGIYGLAGLTVKTSDYLSLIGGLTYNFLFSEGVERTDTFSPRGEGNVQIAMDEVKSDFEWWDVRAGVILYFPDLGL